jgi:hypothetical protein
MAYEKFERKNVRVEESTLSILGGEKIAVNVAAGRILRNNGIKSVVVLWDRSACRIALQAAQKSDKNSYLASFGRGDAATFATKAFLKHIGWSTKERQTVSATWNGTQKMLEAKLPAQFVAGGAKPVKKNQAPAGRDSK